jgi:Tetracyclin repressor-like, C-terminal domain
VRPDDIDTVYRLGGCIYGSLAGELIEADDEVHDDLARGYDQWLELFHAGLAAMRQRGELRADADPRHLAVSLVIAHQGGAMVTHATGDAEPLRVAVQCRSRLRALLRGRSGAAKKPNRVDAAQTQVLSRDAEYENARSDNTIRTRTVGVRSHLASRWARPGGQAAAMDVGDELMDECV